MDVRGQVALQSSFRSLAQSLDATVRTPNLLQQRGHWEQLAGKSKLA
jgi:hypothetical protein